MTEENHYFCVRLPLLGKKTIENYGALEGKLHQTHAQSAGQAVNNIIYRCGGDSRALISKCVHEIYKDPSKLAVDLDKESERPFQYTFWDDNSHKKYLNEIELCEVVKKKLGVRVVDGSEDCLVVVKDYFLHRAEHPLDQ